MFLKCFWRSLPVFFITDPFHSKSSPKRFKKHFFTSCICEIPSIEQSLQEENFLSTRTRRKASYLHPNLKISTDHERIFRNRCLFDKNYTTDRWHLFKESSIPFALICELICLINSRRMACETAHFKVVNGWGPQRFPPVTQAVLAGRKFSKISTILLKACDHYRQNFLKNLPQLIRFKCHWAVLISTVSFYLSSSSSSLSLPSSFFLLFLLLSPLLFLTSLLRCFFSKIPCLKAELSPVSPLSSPSTCHLKLQTDDGLGKAIMPEYPLKCSEIFNVNNTSQTTRNRIDDVFSLCRTVCEKEGPDLKCLGSENRSKDC